jgi:hypothetical protein
MKKTFTVRVHRTVEVTVEASSEQEILEALRGETGEMFLASADPEKTKTRAETAEIRMRPGSKTDAFVREGCLYWSDAAIEADPDPQAN